MKWLNQGKQGQGAQGRERTNSIAGLVVGLMAAMAVAACSEANGSSVEAKEPATVAAASTPSEPVVDGLEERSAERWGLICNGDWIQVYDYYGPDFKATVDLYQFLDGKSHHKYRDASAPRLAAVDGDKAYVEVSVKWTPTHPVIQSTAGGSDIEDLIEMVETWEWQVGQWHFVQNDRRSEFYKEHPELLKKK